MLARSALSVTRAPGQHSMQINNSNDWGDMSAWRICQFEERNAPKEFSPERGEVA
jgi:hypothetical protein